MKSKHFYFYAASALGAMTMIGWSIWSATVAAQVAVSPLESRGAPARVAEEPTPIPAAPPSSLSPPNSPIGLPASPAGATRYFNPDPNRIYPVPQLYSRGDNIPYVTQTDPETLKLLIAHQEKQIEIDHLLSQRREAKDEAVASALRKLLVDATAAQFDLRQQLREREVEQLKERLAEVEKTINERNELKDKIVEKRVADILREPDQLQWESLGITTAPNGAAILPAPIGITPSNVAPALGPVRQSQTKSYVPKTVTSIKSEVIIDKDGNPKLVETPIQETVFVETDGHPAIVPVPDAPNGSADPARAANRFDATTAAVNELVPAPASLSIRETEAWLERERTKSGVITLQMQAVEAWLKLVKTGVITREMQTAEAQLELRKLSLDQAREYAGRLRLLELDVQQAQSIHEQAQTVLAEAMEINKRVPNSVPETQAAARRAAVEQSRIELERARTNLELHQKSNAPQAERSTTEPRPSGR